MMYFPDLSPCGYFPFRVADQLVAGGWPHVVIRNPARRGCGICASMDRSTLGSTYTNWVPARFSRYNDPPRGNTWWRKDRPPVIMV